MVTPGSVVTLGSVNSLKSLHGKANGLCHEFLTDGQSVSTVEVEPLSMGRGGWALVRIPSTVSLSQRLMRCVRCLMGKYKWEAGIFERAQSNGA